MVPSHALDGHYPCHLSGYVTIGLMFAITLQSWLISLFMDCPPNMGFICPSDTAKKVRPCPIYPGHWMHIRSS